jgi:hypothetical protein
MESKLLLIASRVVKPLAVASISMVALSLMYRAIVRAGILKELNRDVYSLGKVLYFLVEEVPPPLGSSEPGYVPAYLTALQDTNMRSTILRAISHKASDRFQSVQELVESLRAGMQSSAL